VCVCVCMCVCVCVSCPARHTALCAMLRLHTWSPCEAIVCTGNTGPAAQSHACTGPCASHGHICHHVQHVACTLGLHSYKQVYIHYHMHGGTTCAHVTCTRCMHMDPHGPPWHARCMHACRYPQGATPPFAMQSALQPTRGNGWTDVRCAHMHMISSKPTAKSNAAIDDAPNPQETPM
jgi:hypothetical protein